METKLVLHTKDNKGEDANNCYCAIILIWSSSGWCNTGIVIHDQDPITAVERAIEIAEAEQLWE